jgi:DNA-binding MarR family transcriptional regulator
VVRLTLTPKGRQTIEELQTVAAGYLTQVFEQMDSGQLSNLVDCLEAFCSAAQSVKGPQVCGAE